ncbi:MAG: ankyrin repeat domain-containing protein [Elusimicrobia bacterium]|nr:ankyrin repeat domain-containing protein [Elusimicrobiota bacterium]
MNGCRIRIVLLVWLCGIWLASCSKKESTSGFGKKSADEVAFESEVNQLIQSGADINQAKKSAGSAQIPYLWCAVSMNFVDATKILLEKGADPNTTRDERSEPVLFQTTCPPMYGGRDDQPMLNRTKAIAELLIQHGANVNYSFVQGETPLHRAAFGGRADLCQLFIEKGALVNATENLLGRTPLHTAAEMGNWEAVQMLLEKGADINLKDKNGVTALTLAEAKRYNERMYRTPNVDYDKTIKVLKERGAQ